MGLCNLKTFAKESSFQDARTLSPSAGAVCSLFFVCAICCGHCRCLHGRSGGSLRVHIGEAEATVHLSSLEYDERIKTGDDLQHIVRLS